MERPQPTERGAAGVVGPPEGRAPQKLRLQGPLQAVWKDKGLWGARPSPETWAGRRKGRAGLRVHRGVQETQAHQAPPGTSPPASLPPPPRPPRREHQALRPMICRVMPPHQSPAPF